MDNVTPIKRRPPQRRRRSTRSLVLAVIFAFVVVGLPVLTRFFSAYIDWLWFGELGLRVVFWRSLVTRLWLGAAAGLVFFAIVYLNIRLAVRLAPRIKASSEGDLVEYRHEGMYKVARLVGLAIALFAGLVAGIAASGQWLAVQRALHAVSFGELDPIFNRDLSFYVFQVPVWHFAQNFLLGAVITALVASTVAHVILGGLETVLGAAPEEAESPLARLLRGGLPSAPRDLSLRLSGRAVAHLSALLGTVFVIVGIGQLFKAWNLLYSKAGVVSGAGYTDIHMRLPVYRILMAVALLIAAALFANIWRRRQYWPGLIVVWVAALIILQGIAPAIMQSLSVSPNEQAKERQYITRNILATRAAYDLADIAQTQFPMKADLNAATVKENAVTVRNIRIWDPKTLVTSYSSLQELRPYYLFVDADVDRYKVGGVTTETMVSARELNIDGLPTQAQTWVNQHITFTHGYGAALSAVNQATPDGSPDFLVQDIPTRSVPGLEITEPRIYFGEIGTDYSLVGTTQKEFDYPGPSGDAYTAYSGSGGIKIGSTFNRLAFAAKFGTIKFFTSSAITGDSRIIIRNNIVDRLKAAAPFLGFDKDPYLVISQGRLYWIADAYTTTDRYPYSTPQGDLNYIRNSVKVVIDAYNGDMVFYAFAPDDPILQTYEAIFPGMFTPADQMPTDLRAHVRYPEGYFDVQAESYATYHIEDPDVLYNKGDQWQIPQGVALSGAGPMDAYYVVMKVPGTANEEFLLMLPFVPNGRDNMVSWLGARSDAPNYGTAVNFLFGKNTNVYGPAQVEAAINNDPTISGQRTLWGQQGSSVIMGNLLVTPIDQALLYVQPLFIQSEATKLPQLKRVIVFYQAASGAGAQSAGRQVVAMQPTLGAALADVFGAAPTGPTTPSPGATVTPTPGATPSGTPAPGGTSAQLRTLIDQANRQFEAAQAAQQVGDWAEYGRQIKALQQTLGQLRSAQ